MHSRNLSVLASALLALTLLSGCTSAKPMPEPTKPSASCFPGIPKVAKEIKAGSSLNITGPGSGGCLVKFTQSNKLLTLTLTGSKDEILASTSVKATATGKYAAKLQVPSTYSGKATVRVDSGFRFKCAEQASCAAPSSQISIASLRS